MPGDRRRRRWGIFFFVAVLAAGGIGVRWAWTRWAPLPLAAGFAAYDRGDWNDALDLARARLKAAPDDVEGMRLSARASFRLGRDEQARAIYRRLVDVPGAMRAEDYYLLGLAMDRKGDHATALKCWEAGRDADPNRVALLHDLGQLYVKIKRYDSAIATARAVAARPGWEARGDLIVGQALYRQGDPKGAAAGLRRALKRDPEALGAAEPPAFYRKLLARALLQAGRPGEARGPLREAGADAEISWLLGRAALQEGATGNAVADLKQGAAYRDDHPLEPEPSPYVGSARCAGCHREISRAQQSSRHARTFQRGAELAGGSLPPGPLPDPVNPKVVHIIKRDGEQTKYEVRAGGEAYRALVEFAFGSGDRGMTLVARDAQGRPRECRLSRYSKIGGWDVTSGQPAEPPPGGVEGYIGRALSTDLAFLCLECHTTQALSARDRKGPESADHGIGCERCHGPGGDHVRAVETGFSDLSIARPGPVAGGRSIVLCRECHSPLGQTVSPGDPQSVRFASTTLTWSRCHAETGGALDCTACHDPHRDLETSPAHYEAQCLTCHGGPQSTSKRRASICPVDPAKGCVKCHMPATRTAFPHSTFTDHDIRVHHKK